MPAKKSKPKSRKPTTPSNDSRPSRPSDDLTGKLTNKNSRKLLRKVDDAVVY